VSIEFRPAKREAAPVLVGIAGPSGGGKTYSALRVARGLANGEPFAMIDTENGRALHYADYFPEMQHAHLRAPFSPAAYTEALLAADAAGYPVIVIDSVSHEWEGDGGVLKMQEAEFERMGKREGARMASWIAPKSAHKDFVRALLQVKAHVLLLMRAEDKVEMVKVGDKTEVRAKQSLTSIDGWIPICERRLPFELTISFLVLPGAPGVPRPVKLQEQHRAFVPLDSPLSEDTGKALAAWAAGGAATSVPVGAAPLVPDSPPVESGEPPVTSAQAKKLNVLVGTLREAGHITTAQLYIAVGRESYPWLADDEEPHWSPLRDSLSKDEASTLIERLQKFQDSKVAA